MAMDIKEFFDNFAVFLRHALSRVELWAKFSSCWRNYGSHFIPFAELWVTFFQTCTELWVKILNQNGTSPSKTRLSYPPPPRVATQGNGKRNLKLICEYEESAGITDGIRYKVLVCSCGYNNQLIHKPR